MADPEQKLQELMLYVAEKSLEDPSFGAVKLNKILAFSDFQAYAVLGHAVTGVPYQKLEHGPAPRPVGHLLRELVEAGDAQLVPRGRGPHVQQRLVALRRPNLNVFSGPEIAVVDDVIDMLREDTATAVSRRSHAWDGWRAARLGDDIPYSTAFWAQHDLTTEDIDRARQLSATA